MRHIDISKTPTHSLLKSMLHCVWICPDVVSKQKEIDRFRNKRWTINLLWHTNKLDDYNLLIDLLLLKMIPFCSNTVKSSVDFNTDIIKKILRVERQKRFIRRVDKLIYGEDK